MPIKDTFLAGILAHVPDADRGKAEAAIEEMEKGTLRQSDYSKLANEADAAKAKFNALYASNTEWFAEKEAALAEVDTLRAKMIEAEKRGTTPADLPADLIRKTDLDKILSETERGAVGFIAEANGLTMKHFKEFNEILDINALLADKRVQQIGLKGVYQDQFKEQIAAKAKAAADAQAEAFRKEGYDRARTELVNSKSPYPVMGNEPSALDAIEATRSGAAPVLKTVDDYASEYARLTGVRATA